LWVSAPTSIRKSCAAHGNEGHLIGNHTWSHRPLFCFLSPRRLRFEIERGSQSIERICGVRTRYFRSPVGLRHPLLRFALQRAGVEFISWRIRSCDTMIKNSGLLARHILSKVSQPRHHPDA
jgi:peptidoglycan/xylan/chitin deacetylase (PgdA/CDA1 family)